MKRIALLLLTFLVLNQCLAQAFKDSTIILKTFKDSATIVFDRDSVKFYIKSATAIKYLTKYREKTSYFGQGTNVLINALKFSPNKTFYIGDRLVYLQNDMPDTLAQQTRYAGPIEQILPDLLDAGEVMLYDVKQHVFVSLIRITKLADGDFAGAFTEFKAYFPNGRLFYYTRIR